MSDQQPEKNQPPSEGPEGAPIPEAEKAKAEKPEIRSKEDFSRLEKEVAALKDKNLRLYAEFDNARKRMERDRVEFVKYANEKLISEFLNVLDNLERTVDVAKAKHQDYDAFLKGIEMVMKELTGLLTKNGVKPIEAKGKKFDPHCEEVLMMEDSGAEEGTVLDELQKGYYLGDRVIRTAKVKIAKKKTPERSDEMTK
jgi:molecular chaperone GrpE